MKKLLCILIFFQAVALERNDTQIDQEESTSFNVTPVDSRKNANSVSVQEGSVLRERMEQMQEEHEVKERRSRCRVITSFIGGITSVLTAIVSVVYAIKECEPKN